MGIRIDSFLEKIMLEGSKALYVPAILKTALRKWDTKRIVTTYEDGEISTLQDEIDAKIDSKNEFLTYEQNEFNKLDAKFKNDKTFSNLKLRNIAEDNLRKTNRDIKILDANRQKLENKRIKLSNKKTKVFKFLKSKAKKEVDTVDDFIAMAEATIAAKEASEVNAADFTANVTSPTTNDDPKPIDVNDLSDIEVDVNSFMDAKSAQLNPDNSKEAPQTADAFLNLADQAIDTKAKDDVEPKKVVAEAKEYFVFKDGVMKPADANGNVMEVVEEDLKIAEEVKEVAETQAQTFDTPLPFSIFSNVKEKTTVFDKETEAWINKVPSKEEQMIIDLKAELAAEKAKKATADVTAELSNLKSTEIDKTTAIKNVRDNARKEKAALSADLATEKAKTASVNVKLDDSTKLNTGLNDANLKLVEENNLLSSRLKKQEESTKVMLEQFAAKMNLEMQAKIQEALGLTPGEATLESSSNTIEPTGKTI